MTEGDPFFSRWSRRKAAARHGEPDLQPEPAPQPTVTEAEALQEKGVDQPIPSEAPPNIPLTAANIADGREPVLAESPESAAEEMPDLPDPESLDYDSDYSVFFNDKVAEGVRNVALRKLWRSNPVLANLDGLCDYDDDFTDAATVVEGMKSAYQVGRGYVSEVLEDAEDSDQPNENLAIKDAPDETAREEEAAGSHPAPPSESQTTAAGDEAGDGKDLFRDGEGNSESTDEDGDSVAS